MRQLTAYRDLTRFEQTFFGLPFVIAGTILSTGSLFQWKIYLWVIPCFILARISGMAFNQLIDAHFDAQNPRTKNRAIPSGRLSLNQARVVAWGAMALFVLLSLQINFTTALLTPIAATLLFIYSYMKRLHASCHFILGAIHFLGATMAYAAVSNSLSTTAICLGIIAATLIIGTDIAYAIQDYDFDCKNHLLSIPSQLGIKNSLLISAFVHFCSLLLLAILGWVASFSLFYYCVIPIVAAIFFFFHSQIWKEFHLNKSIRGIEKSFFLCNASVSFSVLFFILIGSFSLPKQTEEGSISVSYAIQAGSKSGMSCTAKNRSFRFGYI